MRNKLMMLATTISLVATATYAKESKLAMKKVNELKITANSSDLDYEKRVLIFTGDVKVKDEQLELESDLMIITFTEKEEVETFTATSKFDNVIIKIHREGEDDIVATGDEVFYESLTGKVTLSGERTSIKSGGITNVGAKKVVFFVNDDGLTRFNTTGRSTVILERDSNLLKKKDKTKNDRK